MHEVLKTWFKNIFTYSRRIASTQINMVNLYWWPYQIIELLAVASSRSVRLSQRHLYMYVNSDNDVLCINMGCTTYLHPYLIINWSLVDPFLVKVSSSNPETRENMIPTIQRFQRNCLLFQICSRDL